MYRMTASGGKRAAHGGTGQGVGKRRALDPSVADIEDVVPESRQYMELLALEKHLDMAMARKKTAYLNAQRHAQQKVKKQLRVFLSCIAKEENGKLSWKFKVDGKLPQELQKYKTKRQFSNFLDRIFVEFLAKSTDGGSGGQLPAVADSAEWQRSASVEESDGFEIERTAENLTSAVQARVLLYLQHDPAKHRLAPELAGMLGIYQSTRQEVVRALWEYVVLNKLQDPVTPTVIRCDKYMLQCFPGDPQLPFSEIPAKLNRLFLPTQPVELFFEIPETGGQPPRQIYDVAVDVDDSDYERMDLQSHKDLEPFIDKKRDEISMLKKEIGEARLKREFMLTFATDPQEFLAVWLASQAREMVDEGAKGILTEEERAASFYSKQSSKEAVYRYYEEVLRNRHEELTSKRK